MSLFPCEEGGWWFWSEGWRGPFATEEECVAALGDLAAARDARPPWAEAQEDRAPARLDPRDEVTDVMREMQRAMEGEAIGRRRGWTLAELAAYCRRVRGAAIERQLGERAAADTGEARGTT